MKKPHLATKKVVEGVAEKAIIALKLNEWHIEHCYMAGNFPDNPKAGMTIDIDISYLRAVINIWDPAYSIPPEEMRHAYIHELCHIYTENLYSIARANANPHLHVFIEEQREQLTEKIARLVEQLV